MNPLILQLAEQAGWDMGDEVCGFNTRLEKFALLIVLECADALNTMPEYYKTEHDKQIERDTICDSVRTLLEHFGVGE